MKNYDFLIVGGGIFGMTAAIELAKKQYSVGLINPDSIPHHLAASTDVTKAVRMEYGSDMEYCKMAEYSMVRWKEWNNLFDEEIYKEVGYLMLCQESIDSEYQKYERQSLENVQTIGYSLDRLDVEALKNQFPVVNTNNYTEANYNPHGGYAESARAIEKLAEYGRSLGVDIHEEQTAEKLLIENGRLIAVRTKEGNTFYCGHAQIAAGAHSPILLPELKPYMKSTGHPVFWVKPTNPVPFTPPNFCVFTADISNTGWYGFPYLPKYGIVKVAKHTNGIYLDPDKDDRHIKDEEVQDMRSFLSQTFPDLVEAPLVYTRRCLYTDTLDGHFWIDRHPEIEGLSVSTGGSGHGLKMGPAIGEMGAAVAEGGSHRFSDRYQWRHLTNETLQEEEARYIKDRKI